MNGYAAKAISILRRFEMLWYAWVFLVIAILAAIFGFCGIAAGAAGIAKSHHRAPHKMFSNLRA
jgi:hypothetical protein